MIASGRISRMNSKKIDLSNLFGVHPAYPAACDHAYPVIGLVHRCTKIVGLNCAKAPAVERS